MCVGEKEDGPEAIGEFVGEGSVEILGGAEALLRHGELHEIADIADETLCQLGGAPRAGASGGGVRRVKFEDAASVLRELGKRLRRLGH